MSKIRNPKGSGSFKKLKDGRYAWRQTIDGSTRELSAKTLKELKEKIKQVASLPIIKEKYTVSDYFDKWLETYIKPIRKPATYSQYKNIYECHIKTQIGSRKMSNIKTIDLQSVIAEMHKKQLSAWTMKCARIMNVAFKKAVKEGLIGVNPTVDIEIPAKQQKPKKTLNTSDLSALLKAMKRSRWIWSVNFALVTGLRRGELLALRWSDVDFINKRIAIDESDSITGLGDTKSSKIHYVPLSKKAIEYLDKQKQMLKDERNPMVHRSDLKPLDLIFPSARGEMVHPGRYYNMMKKYAKRAGIKATPHSLRHTFVYFMKDELSLKDLQNTLGHDKSTTTLDIYGDMIGSTSKMATQIDEVFSQVEKDMKKSKAIRVNSNNISYLTRVK